jgi:hypothetical protein
MGKLSTVIRMLLLLALAAMLERSVSEEENPQEVSKIVSAKMKLSAIGLFINKINNPNPAKDRTLLSRKLYISFEKMIDSGLVKE